MLRGEDWPSIRGPSFDGTSSELGIVDSFPPEGPPVLWTRELGQGYSVLIAWGDRVATQYQTLAGQFVVCLDAKTGKTIWEHRYGWPYDPAGVYPGPRSSPTYADGKLFFASPTGTIGCLDAQSGALKWKIELSEEFEVALPGFGYAGTPIIAHGKVLLPVGAKGASVVALHPEDGKVIWKSGDDLASYTPIFPIHLEGKAIAVGYLQNVLVGHDLETGERLWRHSLSVGYDEHSAWPIYREPDLWISSPFRNGSEQFKLTTGQPSSLAVVRKSKLMSNDIFSSVLYQGALYGFDLQEAQAKTHRTSRGIFRCIDWTTGEALWSVGTGRLQREPSLVTIAKEEGKDESTKETTIGHSTVLIADNKLILFNDLGELILAKANREKYEELGRVTVLGGEINWTQPTLSQSRLFVRNHSRAVGLFLGSPSLLLETGAKSLSLRDIPQKKLWNLASTILGVEPEYLFDVPSEIWFVEWYLISWFGIFGTFFCLLWLANAVKHRSWLSMPMIASMKPQPAATIFWASVFVAAVLGTTYLSLWKRDFVFTWPLALFVAWHIALSNIASRQELLTARKRLQSGSAALFLLIVSLLYFFLCRRLSLVFEWAFLGGFGFALPFSIVGKHWFRDRSWKPAWELVCTTLAFVAFYWSAVLFLWIRY